MEDIDGRPGPLGQLHERADNSADVGAIVLGTGMDASEWIEANHSNLMLDNESFHSIERGCSLKLTLIAASTRNECCGVFPAVECDLS